MFIARKMFCNIVFFSAKQQHNLGEIIFICISLQSNALSCQQPQTTDNIDQVSSFTFAQINGILIR